MRTTSRPRLTLATIVPRDILSALEALGIDAEERGNEAVALCPHPDHHDRSPSWSCNLDTGEHHCFACGFGGSFMFLVGKMLGKTRGDAEAWVLDRTVKDVAAGHIDRVRTERAAPGVSEADMWRFTEPPGHALTERGLTADACRAYDVRWDDDAQLWITTVRDEDGKLLGWQEKNARHFNNRPKNLVKSRSLYGLSLVPAGGTVLLVESPLDAPYALPGCPDGVIPVSSYGASVSSEQIALLRGRADRIILALDDDKAGWKSVGKLAYAFGVARVDVFNYGSIEFAAGAYAIGRPGGRDPGNLSMDEIAYGIEHAVPARRISIPWL